MKKSNFRLKKHLKIIKTTKLEKNIEAAFSSLFTLGKHNAALYARKKNVYSDW